MCPGNPTHVTAAMDYLPTDLFTYLLAEVVGHCLPLRESCLFWQPLLATYLLTYLLAEVVGHCLPLRVRFQLSNEYLLRYLYDIHRESRAGNRHTRVARMDHTLCVGANMDQCTQTPFPGDELLDPNPFVRSPIKPKATPGVGDKRTRPSDAVSNT